MIKKVGNIYAATTEIVTPTPKTKIVAVENKSEVIIIPTTQELDQVVAGIIKR